MCVVIGITCESIQVFWLLLAREIRIKHPDAFTGAQ